MLLLAIVDDCRIAEAATECLRASPYTVMRRVSCECRHGILFLKGHLFSFHEKQVAQESVARVNGVTQVVNEIEVE
jgi:osmotically-inducible protein OsmY